MAISVELWQPLGGVIANLPEAQQKTLSLSTEDGDTFTFTLSGFDPKAKLIQEMFTDVVVYIDDKKVYRGRVVSAPQTGDATNATLTVSTVDYKSLLKRRFFIAPNIYTGDIENRSWNAINVAQLRAGGNLGITQGVNQTTGIVVTNFGVEAGTSVKDFIDTLSQTNSAMNDSNAFEWNIDPDLVFKVYQPTRGKRTPTFVCDFGGAVLSYDTSFDPSGYANQFYVQGNGPYSSAVTTDDARPPIPGGVFEEWVNDSALTTAALVDARAFWLATYNGQIELTKSYNLEISKARWHGPASVWIGDYVKLDIQHGTVDVQTEEMRVKNMHISEDEGGGEDVAIEVGYSVPSSYRDFNRLSNFMLKTRRDVLTQRAKWYKTISDSLYKEYTSQVKKTGAKSYEAKASLKRYNDWRAQYTNYLNTRNVSSRF